MSRHIETITFFLHYWAIRKGRLNDTPSYTALTREELCSVIEGNGAASRVPVILHFWTNTEDFGVHTKEVEAIVHRYPEDAQVILARMPENFEGTSIAEWNLIDEIIRDFPDPNSTELFPNNPAPDGRYRLAGWYCGLFERHCKLRGIENALADFYLYPNEVQRLYRALTDFYLKLIEHAALELKADGVLTNDDMGMQTAPLFGSNIFDEFFFPYYRELILNAHERGMHFWLHSCGCIEPFLSKFIEIGLDVIHPIQKYTMDEEIIRNKFGGKICVWSGLDVQQIIPKGSPEEVRREVRNQMNTWCRPNGQLIFAAGNKINHDCPIENLIALYDEAYRYGSIIKQELK